MTTPAPGAPVFDPGAAHPEFASVRAAAQAGDWPALRQHFAGRTRTDELVMLAVEVAGVEGVELFLTKVAEQEESSTLPEFLLAARCLELAWDARTSKLAKHVSREQFARMREHLCNGEQLLIDVTALEPEHTAAWTYRIKNGVGLEVGQAEARRRYDRVAATDPHSYRAQKSYLNQLYPKWGGSWEAVFAFVRERAAAAPDGAINATLLADAHFERHVWLEDAERRQYWQRPDVVAELHAAAQRSLLHPAFRRDYGWVTAHSLFALAFCLAGRHDLAAPHFRALGDLADPFGWSQLGGSAAEAFTKHRATALRKG
ncbi:hypothetical protein Cs7R123_28670 [Catellatospora sp. TT07R-123]|uniref:hypothetical protein n=1 Tax=Catellatospora sp. TT07R-123 TaxID=2733863 RepID=UPI001B0BB955|nr:hypothetical protein [Catellatospora sp. TT07R-123]GHJ45525.1 hypothetical protein Cs7R123_28670 [Catellatospora sp. TT07R-123]